MSEFRDTKVAEEGEIVSTEAPDQVNVGQCIADAIRQRKGFGTEVQKPVAKQAAPREVAPEPVQAATSLDRPKSAKRKKLYEKPAAVIQQPKKKEPLAQLFAAIVKKKLGKGIL